PAHLGAGGAAVVDGDLGVRRRLGAGLEDDRAALVGGPAVPRVAADLVVAEEEAGGVADAVVGGEGEVEEEEPVAGDRLGGVAEVVEGLGRGGAGGAEEGDQSESEWSASQGHRSISERGCSE